MSWLIKFGFLLAAAFSIPAVHYVGFLMKTPTQLVSLVGFSFAASFIAGATFHMFLSLIVARVISYVFVGILAIFLSMMANFQGMLKLVAEKVGIDRWKIINKISTYKRRKFARDYLRFLRSSGLIIFAFQFLFAVLLFHIVYLGGSFGNGGLLLGLVILMVVIGGVAMSNFFVMSPKRFFARFRMSGRFYFRLNIYYSIVNTAIAGAVIISFSAGIQRAVQLLQCEPVYYSNEYYSGRLCIVATSEEEVLALEKKSGKSRYIYFSKHFVMIQESRGAAPEDFEEIKMK